MPFSQYFYVKDKYLGMAERERVQSSDTLIIPMSFGYCCPVCGDLWARAPVFGEDKSLRQFRFFHKHCEKCQTPLYLGPAGSLSIPLEEEFNNAFPEEVLQREFHLWLRFYESGGFIYE